MKKLILITACLALAGIAAGCKSTEPAQPADTESIMMQSVVSEASVKEESVEEISYPEGTEEINDDSLKYKSADGRLNVTFPKAFIKKLEPLSDGGLYLSTADGKATLELDYIECKGVSADALKEYLEEEYKDSKAETAQDGAMVFRINTTDKKKNKVTCCMKAVIKDNGYSRAILSFHPADEAKYLPMLENIVIH